MKFSKIILTSAGIALFATNAMAARTMTLYYSPSCPHCHHALDFVHKVLEAEYTDLKVEEVNVTEAANRQRFMDAIKACGVQGGYVPLVVIGDKCFQGFGEATPVDYRGALGAADTQEEAVVEEEAAKLPDEQLAPAPKSTGNSTMLYILLGLVVAAVGVLVFTKRKKK
ncbi:MAG: LPXTG cell wall anchor domain-containing protein [Alphaproteobacteria bacterium]|nr:LPXTG cell wall anchor domain-containing protein [Alphaproteobacteria bacterium]